MPSSVSWIKLICLAFSLYELVTCSATIFAKVSEIIAINRFNITMKLKKQLSRKTSQSISR